MKVNIITAPKDEDPHLINLDPGAVFRLPTGVYPDRIYVRPFKQNPENMQTLLQCPCLSEPSKYYEIVMRGSTRVQPLKITEITVHIDNTSTQP